MKIFVNLMLVMVLSTPLFSSHNPIESNLTVSSKQETQIKRFTFKLNSESVKSKIEQIFSDKDKFIQYRIKSNLDVIVYTEAEMSFNDMDQILISIGNRTKTLQEEVMSKTEYYKNHKK